MLSCSGDLSNLQLVNALLATTFKSAGFPHPFWDYGYTTRLLEPEFRNRDDKAVNPDVVLASRQENHAIIWDIKSGRTVHDEQVEKYLGCSAADLIEQLGIPSRKPSQLGVDTAFLGNSAHQERLLEVLSPYPRVVLMVMDLHSLRIEQGRFSQGGIDAVLQAGISIPATIPTHLVPFDPKEDDEGRLAALVLPTLATFAVRKQQRFSINDVMAAMAPRLFARRNRIRPGSAFVSELRKKTRLLLVKAINKKPLRSYVRRVSVPKGDPSTFELTVRLPLHHRTKVAFLNAISAAIAALKGQELNLYVQQSLFPELDEWGTVEPS